MVQPWLSHFSTMETYLQTIVSWIRIPGLSEAFCKMSLLKEIRSLVRKVVRIDMQTDFGARRQFARFAMQVNMAEPLVSKIRNAKRIHRGKYESLPSIYFSCGRFGHLKEACS